MNDRWPEEDEAKLIVLADIYPPLSCREIAERMGKTRNAIIGKMSRMRDGGAFNHIAITKKQVTDSTWDKADLVFLKNYVKKGIMPSNIARIMRRSKTEVINKIKELGLMV